MAGVETQDFASLHPGVSQWPGNRNAIFRVYPDTIMAGVERLYTQGYHNGWGIEMQYFMFAGIP
jgi:hypothetical protein